MNTLSDLVAGKTRLHVHLPLYLVLINPFAVTLMK